MAAVTSLRDRLRPDPDGAPDRDVAAEPAHSPDNAERPGDDDAAREERQDDAENTFDRTVEEGKSRLGRDWPLLLSTGLVGGVDVGTGVLAYLLVVHATHQPLLGGLAFSIGFIALTLAQSELFTEDFLVPVTAVVARKAPFRQLIRLWVATLVTNLIGGWVITYVMMLAFPQLHETAIEASTHFTHLGLGAQSFALALLAGGAMTLMTWMQHSTTEIMAKIVAAVAFAFLLAGGQLFHSVLESLFFFSALHTGNAPFGYLDYLGELGWAALGNLCGGLLLVTVLRLLQVPGKIAAERTRPESNSPRTAAGRS